MSIDLNKLDPAAVSGRATKASAGEDTNWWDKDIQLFGNSFGDRKKEGFYNELNVLFSAGVDIKSALELVEEEQKKERDKAVFRSIGQRVMSGDSLSEAIRASGKFSDYEFYNLRIGEESGRLPEVLNDLAQYYHKKLAQRRQVVNALSYPVIVLLTAIGAIAFMLQVIVPMFQDIFQRFGGELPSLTRMVIAASDGMGRMSGPVLAFVLGIFALSIWQRKATWYRKFSSQLTLRLPLVGPILSRVYLARTCQSLNLLIGAGLPLVEALELVGKMVRFYPLERALLTIQDGIMKGDALHESLARYPIFPRRLVSLVKVAEEVNQLDLIFGKLAEQYQGEVEHRTSLISSVLEPVLIISIGLFVGIILVAMYLPLFKLGTTIG